MKKFDSMETKLHYIGKLRKFYDNSDRKSFYADVKLMKLLDLFLLSDSVKIVMDYGKGFYTPSADFFHINTFLKN